ncbi:MAG: AMP-binding protein, partial [Alphaproteobacteria bacterium]|nr:AMP-binding protein [Alphaproteobacteria bacterium]
MSVSSVQHRSLLDVLRRRAVEQRDAPVYIHLVDGEREEISLTFGALWRRTLAVAHALYEAGLEGERAVLAYPPGLDFAPAFFGCLLAGVVAVPAPPFDPSRPARSLARLTSIVRDARPMAFLTVSSEELPEALHGLRRVDTDTLPMAEGWTPPPAPEPSSLAYLQYTSGSTSEPKGVMLTHENLWWNCVEIDEAYAIGPDATMVCWVPTFHDLGLLYGLAMPVFGGGRCVSLPASAFLRRPARWLQALSRYQGTHSAGPNAAYDLAVLKVRPSEREGLDLSRWRAAVNGAEPVSAATERRFADVYAPFGFRPETFSHSFGMSEATAKVTAERPGDRMRFRVLDAAALARGRVVDAPGGTAGLLVASCGVTSRHASVRVVNPEARRALPDDSLGELWVRSPSVGLGYFERPEASAETFGARLEGHTERWLRTGDLGFLREGRVYITGRIKDLIIIRGLNHYPQDIEAGLMGVHPALRVGLAVAVGVPGPSGEALAILAEVRPERAPHPEQVVDAVLQAVAGQGLRPATVALCPPGTVKKTVSGKPRRREMRRLLLEGELSVLHRWDAPAEGTETPEATGPSQALGGRRVLLDAILAAAAATHGDLDADIDPERPLRELGFDSVMLAEYAGRVEALVGRHLPMPLFFDHPSPAELVDALLGEAPEPVAAAAPVAKALDEDPVVLVSMACRFPGGVDSPEALWALLDAGGDAISGFPSDRGWALDGLFDPDPAAVGRVSATQGGFLDDPAGFEPAFFGISPREALLMDPQQRLLLELAWEALERAGLPPSSLRGSPTALFAGMWANTYDRLAPGAAEADDGYALLGASVSVAAGRVAYALGLEGPAVTVDTACSSSLVAMHQAAKALRDGECRLALVGGATVFPTPEPFLWFSRLRTLAPDGRSKAFAAQADGAGWSEGAALLLLARQSEARRRGMPVLAVLRGSAINQDGRSQGLTAPNGPSQQRVIRAALASAGLTPQDVDAVEAHGTGTPLGDPIEAGALLATYGQGRERPLWLGSVKSNLGHTQAAAGVAGVIKVVMALQHGRLPATLHVDAPSPHVDWSGGAVALLTEAQPWPRGAQPRRAGVSSFGISGTNAHVILEEAPAETVLDEVESIGASATPIPLSARSIEGLRAQAERWAAWLEAHPEEPLPAVARTGALHRSAWTHRAVVVAEDATQAAEALKSLAEDRPDGRVSTGEAGSGPLAFMFTGQGSQRLGMGRALSEAQPAFREALMSTCAALDPHLERPLLEVMWAEPGSPEAALLDRTDFTQPALFALEVALFALWRSWGVQPDVLLGHSIGELVAAQVAGVLSLADAAELVCARGRGMAALPEGGAMWALSTSEAQVRPLLGQGVELAAVNGPEACVISGAEAACAALVEALPELSARRLEVSHAFHSGLMAPMLEGFAEVVRRMAFRPPRIPIVSSVTGALATAEQLTDPDYWVQQARQTVRFADGVATLRAQGVVAALELGPRGTLSAAAGALAAAPSLRARSREDQAMHQAAGRLWTLGVALDWDALLPPSVRLSALPTTAFVRERLWLEAPKSIANAGDLGLEALAHPLLRAMLASGDGERLTLSGRLSLDLQPWLSDHRVF